MDTAPDLLASCSYVLAGLAFYALVGYGIYQWVQHAKRKNAAPPLPDIPQNNRVDTFETKKGHVIVEWFPWFSNQAEHSAQYRAQGGDEFVKRKMAELLKANPDVRLADYISAYFVRVESVERTWNTPAPEPKDTLREQLQQELAEIDARVLTLDSLHSKEAALREKYKDRLLADEDFRFYFDALLNQKRQRILSNN